MAATTESNPASGAAKSLAVIREAAWGTTPSTPALVAVRNSSSNISMGPEYFQSAEMNTLRVRKENRKTYEGASFQIGGEMIYGNLDTILECLLTDEWDTNVLTEDSAFGSMTIEDFLSDAQTPFYRFVKGAVPTDLQLGIDGTGNNGVTFQVNGIAKEYDTATSSLDADSTYTDSNTNDPMVAAQATVSVDDSEVTAVSLTLNISNAMQALRAIGSTGPAHIAPNGFREVSGTVVFYVQDRTWIEKAKNETGFDLDIVLSDAATGGNSYTIAIPTCSVNGEPSIEGGEGSYRVSVPFIAVNSSGSATMTITRAAAA